MKRLLSLLLLCSSAAYGQRVWPANAYNGPFSKQPGCYATRVGMRYVVTDAADASTCDAGGGATAADCYCNGTTWVATSTIVGAVGGAGEANTGANLGGGLANYDSKSGVSLRFNSFAAADFDLATNLLSIDDTKWAKDSELPTEASLEALLDLQDLQGAVTDAQVPNDVTIDLATLATTATTANAGDSATAFFSAGTIEDARIDGSAEADELVLAGDVDGAANAGDLDELAVETELEGVLDLSELQGAVTDAQVPNTITVDLATAATTATTADTANAGDSATAFFSAGTLEVARLATGTPAAGTYVDGGTGAWTTLPTGSSSDTKGIFNFATTTAPACSNGGGTTTYVGGTSGAGSTTETSVARLVIPIAGTIGNLRAWLGGNVAASETATITVMVNGVASTLTCAIAAASATCNDTTHLPAVNAGDQVNIRTNCAGGTTALNARTSYAFTVQ